VDNTKPNAIKEFQKELELQKTQLVSFEKEMKERLRFEELLTEISTHFISLPPDRIDNEIKSAQQRICECLRIDMTTLWQRDAKNPAEFVMTHFYRAMDGPPLPERINATKYVPWSFRQVLAGKIISIPSTANAPLEAAREMEVWRQYKVKASLAIPLSVGNEWRWTPKFGQCVKL